MTSELSSKISKFIEANGFELGSYGTGGAIHGEGRPRGVTVCPEYSPIDGGHTVVVTEDTVYNCLIRYPTNYTNWYVSKSRKYETQDELLSILKEATKQPQGCW